MSRLIVLISVLSGSSGLWAMDEERVPEFKSSTSSCLDPSERLMVRNSHDYDGNLSLKQLDEAVESIVKQLSQELDKLPVKKKPVPLPIEKRLLNIIKKFDGLSENHDGAKISLIKKIIHGKISSFKAVDKENIRSLKMNLLSSKLSLENRVELVNFIESHYWN